MSRRLLEWAAGRLGTPDLVESAADLFEDRLGREGVRAANRWYRRQARSAVWHLVRGGRRAARRRRRGVSGRNVGSPVFGGLSLDARLAGRMLVRYPGLTVVGGLAMAFAIAVGAATFEFINTMLDPRLPLPAGDRIVGLRYWDRAENDERVPVIEDLRRWREELTSLEGIGGFQTVERTISAGPEGGEPVLVARMSPIGFRVARVRPLLGRALLEADAEPGAAPVVVLGHRVWQTRFRGEPEVVGREVRLGGSRATVVGVMPEAFGFPRHHAAWVPLRLEDADPAQDDPAGTVRVFARLAPDATMEGARAELAAVAARMALEDPGRHEHLAPQLLPYTESLSGISLSFLIRAMLYQLNVYAALFLILVAANVALLMFARAATRERELLVRNALGASRGRILGQLFVEALALATLAAVIGLAATGPLLEWVYGRITLMGATLSFWERPALSPPTAVYAILLTVIGAVVAGVVPGLKVTGRGMQARLRQAGTGAGGLRLGGIWTVIIVTQIAATVLFTGVAYVITRQAVRSASVEAHFPAEEYLGVRVELDRSSTSPVSDSADDDFLRRYALHVRELERRIADQPAVTAVTLADRLPLKAHAPATVEVDDGGSPPPDSGRPEHPVFSAVVDLDFFQVLGAPVLAGRGFDFGDLDEEARSIVVNASFVDEVLGGRSAVGRRIRYVAAESGLEPGPWHPIVGVVRDLVAGGAGSLDLQDPPRARIYHPLRPGAAGSYPVHLVAHVRGSPTTLVPTLHRAAAAISPELRLHEPLRLDQANSDLAVGWSLYAHIVMLVSGIALFLSLAGIYSVMSFTVSRRVREIGIRVALGARPARVVRDIFHAPLAQIAAGVTIGSAPLAPVVWLITDGRAAPGDAALLLAGAIGMIVVCALACAIPTRRALRVEPAQALAAEQ